MQSDDAIRRIRAWHAGKPQPRYSTLHVPKPDEEDARILVFVRMAGESAPWGVAIGAPGEKPSIWSVPEPRNRDLVADMMASCAPALLSHFRHPEVAPAEGRMTGPDDRVALRQIWMPNGSHLDMLHALAYAYAFTKFGEPARAQMLNRLGRLAGWLFREAQRPGQVTVMVATEVLRRAFAFPAENVRQAHLGYLMAWLQTRGSRDRRLSAAHEAEQHSISTTMDPSVERDRLAPEVERWNEDRLGTGGKRAAKAIGAILTEELERRYSLVEQAMAAVTADRRPVNSGVRQLAAESVRELYYQYVRLEEKKESEVDGPVWIPSPETDKHSAAAASRYFVHAASADFRAAVLLHDDVELQQEVIAAGDGIRGTITKVEDISETRGVRPVWTIKAALEGPLRIREDADLCVGGLPGRTVRVESIEQLNGEFVQLRVEVTGLKTVPRGNTNPRILPATDARLKSQTVTLLPVNRSQISRMKNQKIWKSDQPGSWLTHAVPAGGVDEPVVVERELRSLDDVFAR
jgi:hypothetical protein